MIAVGGENLIDLVQSQDEAAAEEFTAVPGGSCYNCAVALGRLGAEVAYVTPISTDTFGDQLYTKLTDAGVRNPYPRVANPTSLAVVTTRQGQPTYKFYRDGTADRQITAARVIEGCEGADFFQVGGLALVDGEDADIWVEVAQHLSQQGTRISIDPNIRPALIADEGAFRARIQRVLEIASVMKVSDEDLTWLFNGVPAMDAFESLNRQTSAQIQIMTMGSKGAVLRSGGTEARVDAYPVAEFIDSVGAGDTFMAATLAYLVEEDLSAIEEVGTNQLAALGEFASQAAAITCSRRGCNPPTREQMP